MAANQLEVNWGQIPIKSPDEFSPNPATDRIYNKTDYSLVLITLDAIKYIAF